MVSTVVFASARSRSRAQSCAPAPRPAPQAHRQSAREGARAREESCATRRERHRPRLALRARRCSAAVGCAGRRGGGLTASGCARWLASLGLTATFAVGLALVRAARRGGAFFAAFFLIVLVFLLSLNQIG